MRESAERKGRRYLTEVRLIIERVDMTGIRATCRGGEALYTLGYGTAAGIATVRRSAAAHISAP
jgi:hypothetical protein